MEDNITRQAEEIEALCSIYGEEWCTEDICNHAYSISISEGGQNATLYITLPSDYPSHSPPNYQLSAPSLSRQDKQELSGRLENIFIENLGENILYQWVEAAKEFLQAKINQNASGFEKQDEIDEVCVGISNSMLQSLEPKDVPPITHGEIIVDRKSIFQGHVATIFSVEQVKLVMSVLMENRKIANATHNIYAYRVEKNGCLVQDCEDDGETAAGSRLLHLLQIMDVMNVMVVVSRWYGGVHLGSDRFRHINNAARKVLEQSGLAGKKK